ncbi:hypothetical protein LB505_008882 [Fusarium chuoi]|nr:hypothetical protein LB505_008882 [Fusarium chuoi]
MLVVKGSQEEIAEALKGQEYETACINSPVETVLAGPNERIAKVKEQLTLASFKTTLLKVPYAFHSSQLEPVVSDIEKLASKVLSSRVRTLSTPHISPDTLDSQSTCSPH